jgi:hypothetical protein
MLHVSDTAKVELLNRKRAAQAKQVPRLKVKAKGDC